MHAFLLTKLCSFENHKTSQKFGHTSPWKGLCVLFSTSNNKDIKDILLQNWIMHLAIVLTKKINLLGGQLCGVEFKGLLVGRVIPHGSLSYALKPHKPIASRTG